MPHGLKSVPVFATGVPMKRQCNVNVNARASAWACTIRTCACRVQCFTRQPPKLFAAHDRKRSKTQRHHTQALKKIKLTPQTRERLLFNVFTAHHQRVRPAHTHITAPRINPHMQSGQCKEIESVKMCVLPWHLSVNGWREAVERGSARTSTACGRDQTSNGMMDPAASPRPPRPASHSATNSIRVDELCLMPWIPASRSREEREEGENVYMCILPEALIPAIAD